jgi:hypothetical protein
MYSICCCVDVAAYVYHTAPREKGQYEAKMLHFTPTVVIFLTWRILEIR